LIPFESDLKAFVETKEMESEVYSNWGRLCLAISKLFEWLSVEGQDEETHIETTASYFERGMSCLERALELNPNDQQLKCYVEELHTTTGLVPDSGTHIDQSEAVEDEEDPDFVPSEEGPSSEDSLSDLDEDADEDDDSEEVESSEDVPEVSFEPGQEIVTGTRSSALNTPSALAEDEDEAIDPDFVPQDSDVEEDLESNEECPEDQDSDVEDLESNECAEDQVSDAEESAEAEKISVIQLESLPTELLVKEPLLEDEPEELDPEFIPNVKRVEEDFASSDSDEPVQKHLEKSDQSGEDGSFAPLPSDEENLSGASE